ncbi:MAG TPA: sulfite exporter TauE/SafE family protein, partial [Vicinamibacteria bacterium]|nr:sulfite exporter TauE/SafE family protein [Vicinamibacteria bacterium]
GRIREGDKEYVYRVRRLPVAMSSSLVAGAVSGLLGLGGGIIKVPVLNTFCGIPIRVAAATSTFMIGVTAAASAFLYFSRGDVALGLTAAVCLGALPGSLLGARLSDRVRARSLKLLMAVVLLVVAVRMALEGR